MLEKSERRRVPLKFIVRGLDDGPKSKNQAKVIASHVSGTYKRWRRTRSHHDLHCSTKAILGPKTPYALETSAEAFIKIEAHHDDCLRDRDHRPLPHIEISQHSLKTFFPDSTIGSQTLDPFTPLHSGIDPKVEPHLRFYFKILLPFARHLLQPWMWYDNLPRIQATPVLAYAISAFASVFLSGCIGGGPLVVLPPPTANPQKALWPVPPWLHLHTKCVSELSTLISAGDSTQTETVFEAVLLLFSLSVLLADGQAARMHFKALMFLAEKTGRDPVSLKTELAVLRDNIVAAFVHHPSVVIVSTQSKTSKVGYRQIVRMEKGPAWRERDWYNREAMLTGRLLVWSADRPSAEIRVDTLAAILRMDPKSDMTDSDRPEDLCRCYQIALWLAMYLNAIAFNTSAPHARSNLTELHARLSAMDLDEMVTQWPCTMFNLLLIGAMGSRWMPERGWFVHRLANCYPEIKHMEDVWDMLGQFIDPFIIITSILDEIWLDVLTLRNPGANGKKPVRLYLKETTRQVSDQGRPFTYSPDIKSPPKIVEVEG